MPARSIVTHLLEDEDVDVDIDVLPKRRREDVDTEAETLAPAKRRTKEEVEEFFASLQEMEGKD